MYQLVTKTLPQSGGGMALFLSSLLIGADFVSVPEPEFPYLESEIYRGVSNFEIHRNVKYNRK